MDMYVVIGINIDNSAYEIDGTEIDAEVLHITADYNIASQKRLAYIYDYDIVRILEGEWDEATD